MPVYFNDVVRQEEVPLAATVDQTLACLQRQLVLEFPVHYYLIAISAGAGCMDLGFVLGGQRTLVK